MVEEARFREVMGHFATGVTVVTTRDPDGIPVGLTVSALTSVSLRPTLLLICVHQEAASHDELLRSGTFAVNVLAADQSGLAMRFARSKPAERFRGVEVESGPLGNPLLPGFLAWLECDVREVWSGGDHSVVLGEVMECAARPGDPLLFFRSQLKGGEW
jgi:flavin reductase (DIM6/NTAB) family NADH-FMN oxidoreductase RutF